MSITRAEDYCIQRNTKALCENSTESRLKEAELLTLPWVLDEVSKDPETHIFARPDNMTDAEKHYWKGDRILTPTS